jgi:hypothetical protein
MSASATCIASSRVGTRIRALGWCGRARPPCATRASSGRPNARVLPEPVWPRPSTSRPARASGMVAAWISNGVVRPSRVSTRTSSAGTPRSAKVLSGTGIATTSSAATVSAGADSTATASVSAISATSGEGLSKTDGNVLGSAKVVKRTSLRGRMLANGPPRLPPSGVNRPLYCPQERPWRAPGARRVNNFHQCTGQHSSCCPHSAPVVGRLTLGATSPA